VGMVVDSRQPGKPGNITWISARNSEFAVDCDGLPRSERPPTAWVTDHPVCSSDLGGVSNAAPATLQVGDAPGRFVSGCLVRLQIGYR
jgi:hypothetical protein